MILFVKDLCEDAPVSLTQGVPPWELRTSLRRMTLQEELAADEHTNLMKDEQEDLAHHRLRALINAEANKVRVAGWYDKKVKIKNFSQGDSVWKLILPIGSRDKKYGKWSPTCEGPFWISQCVPSNAYILETLEGQKFAGPLNEKYLMKYYPSIWVDP